MDSILGFLWTQAKSASLFFKFSGASRIDSVKYALPKLNGLAEFSNVHCSLPVVRGIE